MIEEQKQKTHSPLEDISMSAACERRMPLNLDSTCAVFSCNCYGRVPKDDRQNASATF